MIIIVIKIAVFIASIFCCRQTGWPKLCDDYFRKFVFSRIGMRVYQINYAAMALAHSNTGLRLYIRVSTQNAIKFENIILMKLADTQHPNLNIFILLLVQYTNM